MPTLKYTLFIHVSIHSLQSDSNYRAVSHFLKRSSQRDLSWNYDTICALFSLLTVSSCLASVNRASSRLLPNNPLHLQTLANQAHVFVSRLALGTSLRHRTMSHSKPVQPTSFARAPADSVVHLTFTLNYHHSSYAWSVLAQLCYSHFQR